MGKYDKARVVTLLKQERTEQNIRELMDLNYGLLVAQLKKFGMLNDPDAYSLGFEALYKAIAAFDPVNNSKLSTFATVLIYNAIGNIARKSQRVSNLDEVSYNTECEDGLTFLDMLQSDLTADGEHDYEELKKVLVKAIVKSYAQLSNPVHIVVIKSWIESEFTETQARLAERHKVSQVYIVQIIKKFRLMIKSNMEELQ